MIFVCEPDFNGGENYVIKTGLKNQCISKKELNWLNLDKFFVCTSYKTQLVFDCVKIGSTKTYYSVLHSYNSMTTLLKQHCCTFYQAFLYAQNK